MKTYKINKVPLSFYFDCFFKNNKLYLFQETADGWVHTKFICSTSKSKIHSLTHDKEFIYVEI